MLRFQEDGDYSAFEELFRRHKDAFVAFLTRLSGERMVAEDVSQQVWLKLIDVARSGGYSAGARFRTYLYTLGRNRYIDEHHRKHAASRTERWDEEDTADAAAGRGRADLPDEAQREALGSALDAALRKLPLEQREVIALWSNGASIELMTSVTGAPRETVLSRRKYALRKLRRSLTQAGIVSSDL